MLIYRLRRGQGEAAVWHVRSEQLRVTHQGRIQNNAQVYRLFKQCVSLSFAQTKVLRHSLASVHVLH